MKIGIGYMSPKKRAPEPGWEFGRVRGDEERLSGGGDT